MEPWLSAWRMPQTLALEPWIKLLAASASNVASVAWIQSAFFSSNLLSGYAGDYRCGAISD